MKSSIRKAIEDGNTITLVPNRASDFDVGDVVRLISGSPHMTVTGVHYSEHDLSVCWFSENTLHSWRLPTNAVRKVESDEPSVSEAS